jgi:hypothetical protein
MINDKFKQRNSEIFVGFCRWVILNVVTGFGYLILQLMFWRSDKKTHLLFISYLIEEIENWFN